MPLAAPAVRRPRLASPETALALEAVLMKHRKAVIERQFPQERMASAAIDLRAGEPGTRRG